MAVRSRVAKTSLWSLGLSALLGLGCTSSPSWLPGADEPAPAQPVSPGEPDFDPRKIDELIPGLTPQEQVRGWFGEPDVRNQRSDGTSEWIYNEARLREEDPAREAMLRKARERVRAREAAQLKKETDDLFELGRRSVYRMVDWVNVTLFYPPNPSLREKIEDREETWAEEDRRRESELPAETERDRADLVLLDDDSQPLNAYDLAIDFSRDGVVDTFRYQRSARRGYLP